MPPAARARRNWLLAVALIALACLALARPLAFDAAAPLRRQGAALRCRGALSPAPTLVVYNRYPKSGSSTMAALLRLLSDRHGYVLVNIRPVSPWWMTGTAIPGVKVVPALSARTPELPPVMASPTEVIQRLLAHGAPAVVMGHFAFPGNFSSDARVAYINLLRETVGQCASDYYFMRKIPQRARW